MSKIKVRFKAINYSYQNITVTVDIECPNFEARETNINKYLNQEAIDAKVIDTEISIKDQQEEWLSELDKSDIMSEKGLDAIIDWKILDEEIKPYNKHEKYEEIVSLLLQAWPGETERIEDFLIIYREMEPEIKYMNLKKRFDITLKVYLTVLKGQAAFGKKLTDIFKGEGLSEKQQNILNERAPYSKYSTSIHKQNRDKELEKHNINKKEDLLNISDKNGKDNNNIRD